MNQNATIIAAAVFFWAIQFIYADAQSDRNEQIRLQQVEIYRQVDFPSPEVRSTQQHFDMNMVIHGPPPPLTVQQISELMKQFWQLTLERTDIPKDIRTRAKEYLEELHRKDAQMTKEKNH